MSPTNLEAESLAIRGLLQWLEQAKQVRSLYDEAHMTLPEPLKRVLGVNGTNPAATAKNTGVSAPTRPPAPVEATPDWIWLRVSDAYLSSIVLAVLRAAAAPVPVKILIERVLGFTNKASAGSIANAGTKLKATGIIRTTDDGWELLKPEMAPVIKGSLIWGPVDIFNKHELAAFRRDAIVHILKIFEGGLQLVQLTEELRKCEWLKLPANKDLVKMDLEALSGEGRVRRRAGASKKWAIPVSDD